MLEPDGTEQNRNDKFERFTERGRRNISPGKPSELSIPKNRSTGNLLGYASTARASQNVPNPRIRFSFDAGVQPGEYDSMSRSPVMTDHEHGLGQSGLRRIRQQPQPRAPTMPSSGSSSRNTSLPRSSSMILELPTSSRKASSGALSPGLASPTFNFTEDLTRFPSESLHSFSFANQSEDFLHNRQNILKRSIEFMKDRTGWAASSAGIASAQARVSGDQEMQSMLELLARANLVGADGMGNPLGIKHGPLTGPATTDGDNIFDKSFLPRSESPEAMGSPNLSPSTTRKILPDHLESSSENRPSVPDRSQTTPNLGQDSEKPSETPNNESPTIAKPISAAIGRPGLKRTYTDTSALTLQNKLVAAMARPYTVGEGSVEDRLLSPSGHQFPPHPAFTGPHPVGPSVHGHSSRWAPAAQAIFTTESTAPWTILAANDLACLVFGVTKAEVRKMGILEVVRDERRAWLEEKLVQPTIDEDFTKLPETQSERGSPKPSNSFFLGKGGVTAQLLSKPASRKLPSRRAATDDGAGSSIAERKQATKGGLNHSSNKSRGVLLCGDVVPIQKRNGATGSASLWVKEKKHGLIWVLEEIHEDVACISMDDEGKVIKVNGSTAAIWGTEADMTGWDISTLLSRIPRQGSDPGSGDVDYAEMSRMRFFTCRNNAQFNIPAVVEKMPNMRGLRVSSFPHIAGIMCLSAESLKITSSNSVFSAALFGQQDPNGLPITDVIPEFDRILHILTEEDGVQLHDGIVIPEHSFRRARALLALRDGKADAASYFLHPDGLPAKHRDGCTIKIDVQMRVVKSEKYNPVVFNDTVIEEEEHVDAVGSVGSSEMVYALWITYSRHLHAVRHTAGTASPLISEQQTPLRQPSPGQNEATSPVDIESDEPKNEMSHASMLTEQLKIAAKKTAAVLTGHDFSHSKDPEKIDVKDPVVEIVQPVVKKTIDDFVILEEMGQGAYGQVKLARNKKTGAKVVLKYVTKRRILVDTWTRDRRLGTVPLEIHVLNYLRREDLRHPNIVEMADFFEDDINYYIEMVPHGLPGMDLFDYIELRVNMEENECRSIFSQVAKAVHHLHTKALVVHRDIKDENVVLDGEGNIKLIDFGSAAYIKNGPFDVFVGTIDYAAPEVLAGKSYRGKEQDVWALGILLYTIVYKENPFYSIDEIMDRDLRVPYIMSDDSIDLIRGMLNRDVDARLDIQGVLDHSWFQEMKDEEDEVGADED